LPGIFRDRTAAIQKAMQEAQKASEEARRKLADIESRLMKLDVEIGMMRDEAEKEGGAEEARIKQRAEEDARKNCGSAQQEIAAAAKSARRELTAYAADLGGGLAQEADSRGCRHRSGAGARICRTDGRGFAKPGGKCSRTGTRIDIALDGFR
jgi:F0F1-type ATP synthase membrane subunit b/b'